MPSATAGHKLNVAYSSLCRDNVPVSDQSCAFSPNPRLKMCGAGPAPTASLKLGFIDTQPTCNVSDRYLLLRAPKILELSVMQEDLLNIDY